MPERFVFSDLRELFAKANEVKSGDQLAGIAAASERERVAAKRQLADLSLDEIVCNPLIDPDQSADCTQFRRAINPRAGVSRQPARVPTQQQFQPIDRQTSPRSPWQKAHED